MADEDMSPLHRKKPCRACRDFKSWMNQGDRNKSTMVRSLDHHKIKRIRAITYLKEEHHHDVKEKLCYITWVTSSLHMHKCYSIVPNFRFKSSQKSRIIP